MFPLESSLRLWFHFDMRNLLATDSPTKIDQVLRDAALEAHALADDHPALAPVAERLDGVRQGLAAARERDEQAQSKVRVWTRRVQRRDKAVKKAAVKVHEALKPHADEAGVAGVLHDAFPVSATEGTRGLAEETQSNFVKNIITRVRSAQDMPAKAVQRVAELESALARLHEAVASRATARGEAVQTSAAVETAATRARTVHSEAYFEVGNHVGKALAEEVFAR